MPPATADSTPALPPVAPVAAERDGPRLRLDFIDGLRGLAILMVIERHLYMEIYNMGLPRWADVMGLGYLGVHLFLLLSGFCIAWGFVGPRPRDMTLREFAGRRATRILPTYYVVLAFFLFLALPMSAGEFGWQLATHLLMVHNLFEETTLAINGVFWSLALECQLYVAFPLLLEGFRRRGIAFTLTVVFMLQMAYRVLVANTVGDAYTSTYAWAVFGRLFEFTLGMWAAVLVTQTTRQEFSRRWRTALPLLCLLCGALALLAKRSFGLYAPLTDLGWSLAFFFLLLSGSVAHSPLHRLLCWRPLVWTGVISYSVYLMHTFPLSRLAHSVRPYFAPLPMLLLGNALVVSGVLVFCYGFYRLIEKPSVDYFARKRRAAASDA